MSQSADTTATGPAPWSELFRRGHLALLAVLCLGVWLHAADSLLVATLMPSAVRDIGGLPYLSWTLALYELGSIISAVATGVLVTRVGMRKVMTSAAALYTLGCVISALAPDMAAMLFGRILQGIGGGMMLAGTFTGMNRLFPQRLWLRIVAIVSATWGVSSLIGPLIGGLFANYGYWRGGFWAFAAQAVLFGLASAHLLGPAAPRDDTETSSGVDWKNLGLLSLGVFAIAAAGAHVSLVWTPLLCIAGSALLWAFVRRDGVSPARMLAIRPLNLGHAPGAGTVMVLASAVASVSLFVYGPIIMQTLYGIDPLTAGYIVAIESVAWSVAAIAVSGAGPRLEPWIIRSGSVLITLSVIGLTVYMPTGPVVALLPFAVMQGAGFGMAWAFVVRRAISGAPEADRDRISSVLPSVQMLGYAIGASLAGIIANAAGFSEGVSLDAARSVGFWVFAAFIPLAFAANIAAWKLSAARHAIGAGTD